MHRRLLLPLAAVSVVLGPVAAADAATVSCKPGRYLDARPNGARIDLLRATNLPARTDGYAPRCLVAETAVQEVIMTAARNAGRVRSVRLYGAQWSAGTWSVSVRNSAEGSRWTVRRGSRRITFRSR